MQYQNQNDKLKKHKATFAPFDLFKVQVRILFILTVLLADLFVKLTNNQKVQLSKSI